MGVRWKEKPTRLATLLLGLYDKGELQYVGSCAVAASRHDMTLELVKPLLKGAPERGFSEPNRWGGGELAESALRPELVVEVRYDKVEKHRIRHGTRFLRFRADKDPADCTWTQVRPRRRRSDPTIDSLLGVRPEEDAYGAMMLAALDGRGSPEIVERDDGFVEAANFHETYLAPFRRWPAHTRAGHALRPRPGTRRRVRRRPRLPPPPGTRARGRGHRHLARRHRGVPPAAACSTPASAG